MKPNRSKNLKAYWKSKTKEERAQMVKKMQDAALVSRRAAYKLLKEQKI